MEWNGLKFLAPTGMFLDVEENRVLHAIAASNDRTYAPWQHAGSHSVEDGWIQKHIQAVLSLGYMDVPLIRKRQFKVVIDCVDSAGGLIVPPLLNELGCNIVQMNCDVKGVFSHPPEPVPENLNELMARVRSERADLGIAVDPDVDRLVLVTEKGEPYGEEYTVASVVKFVLE
jgi:phosphomannomutase